MTKFIRGIFLLIPFLTLEDVLAIQKWPYFSTDNIKNKYIFLNAPFKKSSNITDSKYLYYFKHSSALRKQINERIEGKKGSILLVPDSEESAKKNVNYFVFINDLMVGITKLSREKKHKH